MRQKKKDNSFKYDVKYNENDIQKLNKAFCFK